MKKQFFLSALALTTALMTLDVSLPTFANATAIIQREELAYWIDRAEQAQAPDYAQPWFDAAIAVEAAYGQRLRLVEDDLSVERFSTVPLVGHTPGHQGIVYQNGDE